MREAVLRPGVQRYVSFLRSAERIKKGVDWRQFRIHDGGIACAGFGRETSVMTNELTPGELDRFAHTMAREVAKLIYRVGTVRGGDSQGDLVVRKAVLVEALADYFFF
jgi:hypothetical protein